MKILIGKISHETNTFSSEIGTFERWSSNEWCVGPEMLTRYTQSGGHITGMIKAATELEVEVIPSVAVNEAGPLILREVLDRVTGHLLNAARAHKDEIDGICLALHGAGCAEGVFDIETHILREVRAIVGNDIPITVGMDLHGNISPEMMGLAQGFYGVKEYPHIDSEEMGHLAMTTLIRHLKGEIKLQSAVVNLPMMIPPSMACTFDPPMRDFKEFVAQYVEENGLIDATLFHGFPYADIPWCGTSVVVVADGDPLPHAQAIARYVWKHREALRAQCLSVSEALDQAQALVAEGKKYIVINEASDNPGGGAPCNGTWLLRELVARDVPRSIVGYIHDTEIALAAHKAGVGGKVSGLLGGKTDIIHGAPLEIQDAVVCALSDGIAIRTSPMGAGREVHFGRTARLRIGRVEVMVAENMAGQTLDDAVFRAGGADVEFYDIVAVKSTNHFKAFFAPRATAIITADPPGIHTANYSQLTYHNIRRPIWPIDDGVTFEG